MSTVIKGLSMPKNCLLCPCCVGEGIGAGRQHYCQAIDDEPCVSETYRPKNCPLIEIPTPHGRLIDADELYEQFINEFCNRNCDESVRGEICDRCGVLRAINMIKSAPTVIEAENSSAIDDDVKKYCDYLKSETYDFCNRIENGEVSEE